VWPSDDVRSCSAARTTGDVECHESVPAEQERAILEKQRAAAGRMAGGMDDAGRSGHIQDFSVGKRVELCDRRLRVTPFARFRSM
jgi:hypothetical protein